MTIEEENKLLIALQNNRVLWVPDNETAREVVRIVSREDEPSSCALFARGDYVALYNCPLRDFKIVKEIE